MAVRDFHAGVGRLLASPLTCPALQPRPHGQVLLWVWLRPSFTPAASWAWIRDGQQEFVRRVVVGPSPNAVGEPVSYGAERAVAPGELADLQQALGKVVCQPFQAPASMGLDGCMHGVAANTGFVTTALSWWESPPSTWVRLARWHAQAIARLNTGLPASTWPLSLPQALAD